MRAIDIIMNTADEERKFTICDIYSADGYLKIEVFENGYSVKLHLEKIYHDLDFSYVAIEVLSQLQKHFECDGVIGDIYSIGNESFLR